MPFDYSDAKPPKIDLIPPDTIATVSMHIRAGGVGEDELLTRSGAGDCEMLNLEFVVLDGTYKGRKFWMYLVLDGTKEGHARAADISRVTLRAILDSALGLEPTDMSAEAHAARTVSLKKFNGIAFVAKIGIEKGGPNNKKIGEFWPDKNILAGVITKDKKDWHPVEQPPPFTDSAASSGASSTPAVPVERPGWAV
jgi:hypothetical protein